MNGLSAIPVDQQTYWRPMKSKVENWIEYPTLIPHLFYLAHAFYLPRLSKFLNSTTPESYYQWPIRLILEMVGNQIVGKWIIVAFCLLVYFFSIFFSKKKYIQVLVVMTNLFYIAMNSFPALGINVYESYCFLYFSIALLFFDLKGKFFTDKYKTLIAIAVSPYVLSGLIKIYHYQQFLTDKMLLNKIIEVEYFSNQTSFLIPFLKGHDIPTYPLFPLVIALQISGVFAISSPGFRKIWIPSTLLFHLFNTILFNINFFFSFLILPFSFFNSKENTERTEKSIIALTFYSLLIFTGQILYKLTTLSLPESELSLLRAYSILYLLVIFAGIFLHKKHFIRIMVLGFLITNATLFLIYNIPFSFPDYLVVIFLAFALLKDLYRPLEIISEYLFKGLVFIGGLRAILVVALTIERLSAFHFSRKIPDALYLMMELPLSSQWNSLVFLVIAILEIFYRRLSLKSWALPLLLVTHLYLASFSNITSSYYLFWIISLSMLCNVKNSNIPNKWTITSTER